MNWSRNVNTLDVGIKASVITALLFTLMVGGLKFGVHEMWKDEWQAWFLSRDLGWIELLQFLFYEGHPALFYLFIKPFAIVFPAGDFGLKLAHTLIWGLMAYYWLRLKIPFWVKLLFLCSYPFFFEHGIVSRGYALTMLFTYLTIPCKPGDRWLPFLLFLLCQTEIQGVWIAGCIVAVYLLGEGWSKKIVPPMVGLILGLIAFVLTVFPRAEEEELNFAYSANWNELSSWLISFQGSSANVFFMGFIPDTNVFGWSGLGVGLGVLAIGCIAYMFWDQKKAGIFFGLYFLATWAFHGIIYNGGLRQWSMVLIAFGGALAFVTPQFWQSSKKYILLMLLMGPIYYSILGVSKDISMPFTNSQAAGDFIIKNAPEDVPIIAINKFECTPVVGHAERPFYALPDGMPFTYFKWVEKVYIPTSGELDLFCKYKGVGGLVIVSPFPLDPKRFPKIKEWQRFDAPNLKGESYILYTHKLN